MASVSILTITKKELESRSEAQKLTFVNLENSKPIIYSFGPLLGHTKYDEGAAIKALVRHWIAIYEIAPNNVLEPKYLVSSQSEGREKIVGVAVEKIGNKSLSDFVLARAPISPTKTSENQFQLRLAAEQFYESMEKINKFGLYHGNPVPDLISVFFYGDMVGLKVGSPMLANSNAQHEELLQNDKKRRREFQDLMRIGDLGQRAEFLSNLL